MHFLNLLFVVAAVTTSAFAAPVNGGNEEPTLTERGTCASTTVLVIGRPSRKVLVDLN
jgi:hypothetical protein